MAKKAVKALQMAISLLPKWKKISHGLTLVRRGIFWIHGRNGKDPLQMLVKEQRKQQKKEKGRRRKRAFQLAWKQQKQLVRMGRFIHKRHF